MSEKQDKLAGDLSQKSSLLHILQSFVEHPGWDLYSRMLSEQQDARKGEVLFKPLSASDSVYAQEFMKGEISGLALAQVAPHTQIEVLKLEVKVTREKLEREDELEERSSDVSGTSRVDDPEFTGGSDPFTGTSI